ncbi:hypothetical protein HYU92_04505 [Candidatus Curtissbacteria bacterium]|nr:hypothetical protein [Candidatus Curtissbacteria bacterium]
MLIKFLFFLLAIGLIFLTFFVSWFWRLLLVPMIVILLWDGVRGLIGKN